MKITKALQESDERSEKPKICKSYKEAKKHRREFKKDGRTYSIVPPYEEIIDGVDYGEKDPQPVLMPAILDG